MNDLTPVSRDHQTSISFRSDIAARLLAELTQDGRSEAQVIEDALAREAERAPKPPVKRLSREEFIARIDAIVRPLHGLPGKSREEIEAEMYDGNGLPR